LSGLVCWIPFRRLTSVAVTNREGVLTSEPTIRKRQSGGDHRVAVVELSRKLQINPGSSVAGLGAPPDVRLDLTDDITLVTDPSTTDAVLAFAPTTGDLDTVPHARSAPPHVSGGVDCVSQGRAAWKRIRSVRSPSTPSGRRCGFGRVTSDSRSRTRCSRPQDGA
jgi:hypothetical protein